MSGFSQFLLLTGLIAIVTVKQTQCLYIVEYTKVFTICGLARELYKYKMPLNQLDDWVCLVESESGGDTSKVGGPNPDGSYDYGLFQINSRYWCGLMSASGGCKIRCWDLLSPDIKRDVACAKLIYGQMGFEAWAGWRRKCKNQVLPDVIHCLNATVPSALPQT
ncbi:hypothetical protein L9F63_009897 [Diploptera punctata]|uniref:lysozyme n=1 Tax=Diploptera punctata TaxID=6984 RepID=A0AAD8AIW5_DIPPU|nr:hypothetical protein L9F63_009897 [Diploptera punctata]